MLDDARLLDLLKDLESPSAERKRTAGDRSAIRKAICAFANDLPGDGKPGIVFVGVENDGTCANIEIDDDLLKLLADMRNSGILPIPSMEVDQRVLDGCKVAIVQVDPSRDPPVRYQGRCWVRVGPSTREATPDNERRLIERRRAADLPFDRRRALDATLDDLDLNFLQREYLPSAFAEEVLTANDWHVKQQLASLRLITGETPCYGAVLVAGRDPLRWIPSAYIQFLGIDGTELADPIKHQKRLVGPLNEVARQLDDLIDLNISVATDITSGAREKRQPDYAAVALQQLVRNALVHRNYETSNAPVHVYWFSDRVEIHSPGGLYGQVTPENFGTGVTDYRNPLVAEALAVLGYIQRFGVGIPMARKALADNGNPPPEFDFQDTAVLTTIRRHP